MKISTDLSVYELAELRYWLRRSHANASATVTASTLKLADDIDDAIQDESEGAEERRHEALTESGGGEPESYRQQLRDAGRGHLVR